MADFAKSEPREVHSWVATVAALVALGFSTYNFAHQLQDDPRVDVALPVTLKMTRDWHGISIFIQPTVATRFSTPDVELITDVQLRLQPDDATVPEPKFFWKRKVKWFVDHGKDAVPKFDIKWEFQADPAPFTVTQATPQQPYLQFTARDWKPTADRYLGTLTVRRSSTSKPMERTFCLRFESTDVTRFMTDPGYQEYRTDVPGHQEGRCFHYDS